MGNAKVQHNGKDIYLRTGESWTLDFDGKPVVTFTNEAIPNLSPLTKAKDMMTQFAPVCGVQMYEQMAIRNILPNYHLLLAHDIVERPDRYATVFRNMERPATIILDNSITELGTAVDVEVISDAARAVKANVIILPDVYMDAQATIKSTEENYDIYLRHFDKALGPDNYSFMVVPQGKTIAEFAWCAEQLSTMSYNRYSKIHWWGVPRNAADLHGTRKHAIQICAALDPTRAIHMLGFSDNVYDDIMMARGGADTFIRGIDSAVPMRCSKAIDGGFDMPAPFSLSITPDQIGKRPESWLEEAELTEIVIKDWQYAKQLISGA